MRFTAERLVDGLDVVKQVGTGVEEARLVLRRHLIAEAQRPFDCDTGIAEIGVVEHLRALAVLETAVEPDDLFELRRRDVPTLVAQASLTVCAATRRPEVSRINELDLALAVLLLAVGDDPDVGADAGVVEHLLGQGDDGFEPVLLDDPLANLALARAC